MHSKDLAKAWVDLGVQVDAVGEFFAQRLGLLFMCVWVGVCINVFMHVCVYKDGWMDGEREREKQ